MLYTNNLNLPSGGLLEPPGIRLGEGGGGGGLRLSTAQGTQKPGGHQFAVIAVRSLGHSLPLLDPTHVSFQLKHLATSHHMPIVARFLPDVPSSLHLSLLPKSLFVLSLVYFGETIFCFKQHIPISL